jgi:hypothetical protein
MLTPVQKVWNIQSPTKFHSAPSGATPPCNAGAFPFLGLHLIARHRKLLPKIFGSCRTLVGFTSSNYPPRLFTSLAQRRSAAHAENDAFCLSAMTASHGCSLIRLNVRQWQSTKHTGVSSKSVERTLSILASGQRATYSSFRRKTSHISTGEGRSTRRVPKRSGVSMRNRCVFYRLADSR